MVHEPSTLLEHFQQVEYHYNNLIRVAFTRVFDSGIWFFSASACYRKELFRHRDYFTNTLTEDMDIALRITKAGYKVLTSSDAVCHTNAPKTIRGLFNQRMRWWFGVLLSLTKNRGVLKQGFSPSIGFLYLNQFWWTFYSVLSLPIFIYQIHYWLPAPPEIFMYLFRWFSLLGPIYVIYKIPDWGLSLLNIFGVASGIISAALIFVAFGLFRKKINIWDILVVFFYFPYTIVLNLVIVASLVKYTLGRKRTFVY
jgi:cellulose synthase/poly-beta-1,6-N-acetylglucosamine synthase-like glycosyltransferase